MQEVAEDEQRDIAGEAIAETDEVAVLQIQQHFLDGHEVEDGAKEPEQANASEDRD